MYFTSGSKFKVRIITAGGKPAGEGKIVKFKIKGTENEYFSLSDHEGKTVVINFWATWCTPCVAELPHFDRLYREGGESLTVLAIHSGFVTEDVEAWLAGYDYAMPFALDEGEAISQSYGVSAMLPHTVIIGPDGEIIYNAPGSLNYEELTELINELPPA